MVKNIILTGFMGTGKTAVGKLLAEMLSYTFIDTDDLIEARDGRSITEIFAESGEAFFRQLERDVASEVAGRSGLVISTGGSLMLEDDNAAVLAQNSRVFCLTAEVDEILARVSSEGEAVRPLLAVSNPRERIAAVLAERSDGYGQYEQVATDGKRPLEVAQMVLKLLKDGTND